MGHNHQLLEDLSVPTKGLAEAAREVMAAFGKLHGAAMADGEISVAVKEAAALAISVVKHCDGCIAYHARAAAKAGATPGQVAEMLGLAVLMEGGPATVYGPRAWEAYQEFAAELAAA